MVKWNGNGFNSKISHHEAKELSEIVMKRITYVPKELGADWRDIPNKEWKMSNGRVTPKLKYPYISAKTGKPAGIVSLSLLHIINHKKMASIAIEQIKTLGAILELPAEKHCQFSPFGPFLR